jgi:Na+-transporting NADH:ubiquinone oxidoreductase subunit C
MPDIGGEVLKKLNPFFWWRKFLDLPNESLTKTLMVAFMLAIVCAIIVSVTAVTLRPLQEANLDLRRQERMQEMVASLPGIAELLGTDSDGVLEIHIVDIDNAKFSTDIEPENYNQREAATNPEFSITLNPDEDIAGLSRRANYAPIYMLRHKDDLALIILPVHGMGYQSTLYGYLALKGDLKTIAGLTFYEQGETPGLGNRIEEAEWEALWAGKEIADANGEILIEVVRGQASGPYQVDGISGATRTGNGVTNLLRFWLGENGFGPFLDKLKTGEI